MSTDKNLTGIKKIINETILCMEWIQENISDNELHNDIHILIMKDEQMDPLDFAIDTDDLTNLKNFLDKEEYNLSEGIELFKISQEVIENFKLLIDGVNGVSESYLHSYLGALFFIYLKKKHKYAPTIVRLIFFIQATTNDNDALAKEYSMQTMLPRSTYERIGSFIMSILQSPKQAFETIRHFLEAVLITPLETGKNILSFYKRDILEKAEDSDIPFLEEIINQEVNYKLSNSNDPEKQIEFSSKVESISPFKLISTANGDVSFQKKISDNWNSVITASIKDLEFILDQGANKTNSFNLGDHLSASLTLTHNNENKISLTLSTLEGTEQTLTVGLSGNGNYIKEWENNWKTEIQAEAKDFEFSFGSGTSQNSSNTEKGNFSIDLNHKKKVSTDNDQEPDKVSGSRFDAGTMEFQFQLSNTGIKALGFVKDCQIVIDPSESDGFLSSIIPLDENISFDLGFEVGYKKSTGFYFTGNLGQEIMLPLSKTVGPVTFRDLFINWSLGNQEQNGLSADFTTSIDLKLGPFACTVEQLGFRAGLDFPEEGPIALSLDFKPPKGIGLSLDASIVKGGGYLFFDPEKEEYSGALELTFSEIISLKAIGVINTKMPDGSDGFSLIVIITAEFGSGIQLGFGFTLLAVGGLLGLNRTMKLNNLADGIRTGAVNGIMFPTNIVENAPRIISDLKNFFPIQQDKFLIGPMAKLAWGTPTLMSISLGIIIEIPGNIAILGVLKIALPTEEAALIVLQVNFMGAIEFDKERLWFFASLYDSRVLFITLEGEMGILVNWGSDSNFLSSVGGFHPAFNPPRLPFPNPVRISLNLLNKSNAKIRVMGYFAVTSNTAQFGARAELYFKFSALKVNGHIGFDALFQFSPFHMVLQFSASLSVKVFGAGVFSIRVKMTLEGPAPWMAHGTGSISLLFWDVDVDIDVTWGESKNTTLPPISIMPLVVAEYEKQENWKALIPANSNLLVSLRKIDALEGLVLHPVGSLQLSQRAIPLNLTLDKLGSQKPDDANRFTLEPSGSDLSKIKTLDEKFAIAQFKDLKDAEKLSSPSYQNIEGGLELSVSGEQFKTGKSVKRYIRYELITIDSNYKRKAEKFFEFLNSLFGHFLGGNTVAKADISHRTALKYQPFTEKIFIQEPGFAVANMMNNKIYSPASEFSSQAQAKEFMNTQISKNPELSGQLHVLPTHEINSAA